MDVFSVFPFVVWGVCAHPDGALRITRPTARPEVVRHRGKGGIALENRGVVRA